MKSVRQQFSTQLRLQGHQIGTSSSLLPLRIRPCCSPTPGWTSSGRVFLVSTSVLQPCRHPHLAEVRARRRQAQRPRKRRWLQPRATTPFEMLSATSASAIISNAMPFGAPGAADRRNGLQTPKDKLTATVYARGPTRPTTSGPSKSACRKRSSASATTRAPVRPSG